MQLTVIRGSGLTKITKQFNLNQSSGRGPTGAAPVELTQAQVENPASTVFGSVSGQRLSQSIVKWAATTTSVFKGILSAYKEASTPLTITVGAGSFAWSTTNNIGKVPSLTQNTVITITGTLTALKPETLETVPDTGGPWTLSYIANGKTKILTRNGSGTADLETFELWSDGTDVFTADDGGLVWSKGT